MTGRKVNSCNTIQEVMELKTGLTAEEIISPPTDPYIYNMDQAEQLLHTAYDEHLSVGIYGDYDLDGVAAAAECYRLLINGMGFLPEDVFVDLPSREGTGYGFQLPAAKKLAEKGIGLLITVDNGVNSYEAIEYVKSKGVRVLVIDHHPLTGNKLPPADVIIDPNADGNKSDYTYYCAAGLVYRLAKQMGFGKLRGLRELAGCATISDVMELKGDNRNLVKQALELINECPADLCVGMLTLMEHAGLTRMTEKDIGFKIGPIVNAADRMNISAMLPWKLFAEDVRNDALAEKLIQNNEQRKVRSEQVMKLVHKNIADECLFGDNPLFIVFTDPRDSKIVTSGLVGIAAGQLAQEKRVPVFISTVTEDGMAHGSARTFGDYNVKEALDLVAEHLVTYGGHPQAAGLSFDPENTDIIREALKGTAKESDTADPDVIEYDLEINASEIASAIEELEKYAPFGQGCRAPIFKVKDFRLEPRNGKFSEVKGNGSTIKLNGPNCTAISFSLADQYLDEGSPKHLILYGELTRNEFTGYRGRISENQVEFIGFEKQCIKEDSQLRSMLLAKLGM